MALRKKSNPRSAPRGRSSTGKTAGGRAHIGFIAEGLRLIFTWLGNLVMGLLSLFAWCGQRAWDALQGRRGRQPFGMALAAVSVFAFVAMLDFEAGDGGQNICGYMGHVLADVMLRFFGVGAFLAPGFGTFWGLARLVRPEGSGNSALKFLGVVVLSMTVSIASHGIVGVAEPNLSFPTGSGGWIGAQTFPALVSALGGFGVTVLLLLLGGVSSLFATEWAFIPLIRDLLKKGTASFRQQELPLSPKRASLAEETRENKSRASRGVKAALSSAAQIMKPFHPAEEEDGGGLGAVKDEGPFRNIPSMSQGQLDSAKNLAVGQTTAQASETRPKPAAANAVSANGAGNTAPANGAIAGGVAAKTAAQGGTATAEPPSGTEVAAPLASPLEEGESLPGISAAPTEKTAQVEFQEPPKRKRRYKKPRLDSLPPHTILEPGETSDRSQMQEEIDELGHRLQSAFNAFSLEAKVVGAERGPTLTLFEVQLAAGVSVRKLNNQRDDLAVALGSHGVRIVYPLPGRTTVGVEVPNLKRDPVRLKEVFESANLDWSTNRLPMVLGRDTLGKPAVEDLSKMPHMLVAGTTGSGKSVCLNSILVTMLLTRTPDQVRFVLIDPKQVELQLYQDIPHLLCPVVTDMKRAPFTLAWAVKQMEDRLFLFKEAGVRNITDYNNLTTKEIKERVGEDYDADEYPDTIPYFVLVIDELADLMMVSAKEVEIAISRLAAKARAAGIHLLVATQRPSTDVVTGLIKMNLPVRMAFRVTSAVDSRVILDESGADSLLGNGDFLYRPPGASALTRGQGAFVSEREVRDICDHLREHGKPEFLEDLVQMKGGSGGEGAVDDPLYEDAVRVILQSGRGSASLLQRALSVGYTRASRLIDIMTEQGVLGPFVGSKAREVMLTVEEWEAQRGKQ